MTETLEAWRPRALSVLRIIAGLMIIEHGMAKLLGWPVVAAFAKLQLFSQLGAAGVIELIGGALLTVGLFTQPVAFILSGEMAVGYFIVHAPRASIRCSTAARWRSCTASPSSICRPRARGRGVSTPR